MRSEGRGSCGQSARPRQPLAVQSLSILIDVLFCKEFIQGLDSLSLNSCVCVCV